MRGVVWSGLGDDARRGVYTDLQAHFETLPMVNDYRSVSRLEDLTPAIELYNTLIGLGRYDDAGILFYSRLNEAMLYRLSASRQRVELLEMLFPNGFDRLPRLDDPRGRAFMLGALAQGYHLSGQPGRAAALYRRQIHWEMKREDERKITLCNLSDAQRLCGAMLEAEASGRHALAISRATKDLFWEAYSLMQFGLAQLAAGMANESVSALQRSLRIFVGRPFDTGEGVVSCFLAQRSLWCEAFADAIRLANRAWELAHVLTLERDFIRAARLQGAAALGLHDLPIADERLHHALTRARQVNYVEEELAALIALAELRRREGKPDEARELLDDVWDSAERGPYPLFHADACNVLAHLERDGGNLDKATDAATQAYRLAWCDGPPFAYHWGLVAAQKHLQELGAPEPEMPPFDESKFEPMPDVEIDLDDEFHADKAPDN